MEIAGFGCDVLVVGAGPVGLATALSLAAQGVDVRIVDDMPARHATPRASAIHARTLELLAPFGVADRIAAYAQPIRRAERRAWSLRHTCAGQVAARRLVRLALPG